MDDLYQLTAEAVNQNTSKEDAEKNKHRQEEDDVVLKAFNSFGFSKRWDSLLDTVKKQGGALVDVTKRDLQEFATVLRDDIVQAGDESQNDTSEEKIDKDQEQTNGESSKGFNLFEVSAAQFASLRESLSKLNTVNLDRMRDGLQHTLSNLPTNMESIHLPGNINIQQLREELAVGSKFAEQYLEKFGTDAVQALSRAITVVAPVDDEDNEFASKSTENNAGGKRIFASRKETILAELRTDHSVYLEPPVKGTEEDHEESKIYHTFVAGFNVEEYTDEIAKLLEEYPELRQFLFKSHTMIFGNGISTEFGRLIKRMRNGGRLFKVRADAHEEDDADFKWDSEDEEGEGASNEKSNTLQPDSPSTSTALPTGVTSDTEFSNISASSTTEASLVSAPKDDDEEDSDWE
ncbi:hypothetical protein BC943DRAFT_340355 [Umbelopsis sp. AD052]|nr:hypothetical protein BC943DRAFT_340355 [Umbelopsis sp. AD052]